MRMSARCVLAHGRGEVSLTVRSDKQTGLVFHESGLTIVTLPKCDWWLLKAFVKFDDVTRINSYEK